MDGAAVLLPTDETAIRRSLGQWFDRPGFQPRILGEFGGYALLRGEKILQQEVLAQ